MTPGYVDGTNTRCEFTSPTGIGVYYYALSKIYVGDVTSTESYLRVISCTNSEYIFYLGSCVKPTTTIYADSFTVAETTLQLYDSTSTSYTIVFNSIGNIAASRIDSSIYFIIDNVGTSSTIYYVDMDSSSGYQYLTGLTLTNARFLSVDASDNVFVSTDDFVAVYLKNAVNYDSGVILAYTSPSVYYGLAAISYEFSATTTVGTYAVYSNYIYKIKYDYSIPSDEVDYFTQLPYDGYGLVLDSSESYLYVSCSDYAIYRVDVSTTSYDLYAGTSGTPGYDDGSLLSALFDANSVMAMDDYDDIYISSATSYSVRVISTNAETVSTIAGATSKTINMKSHINHLSH